MKGSIWLDRKLSDTSSEYRFQVSGIKKGAYTKILDPTFKTWKEVGTGYNNKDSTELVIYSKAFSSDDEMYSWVKTNITFHTVYDKCNVRCTTKILVPQKEEVEDVKATKPRAKKVTKNRGLCKTD